jgi:putative acetyltransferase
LIRLYENHGSRFLGPVMEIVRAETPQEIDAARVLFREYERFLKVDLCFQDFEAELAGLPGKYAPPEGALFLAMALRGSEAGGCVALRRIEPGICEMKRLYVRPEQRGNGLGRQLAVRIIGEGAKLGYRRMRLDTLDRLAEAVRLYRSLGFRQIPAYYDNPLAGVLYWELDLVAAEPPSR